MTRGNDVFLRLAQWVLVGLALLSLLGGAAAALGVSGSSSLYDRHVPRVVAEVAQRVWPGSGEMPSALVKVREEHRTDTYEAFNQISREGGRVPKGWAELPAAPTVGSAGQLTFWDPGILRRTAWLIVISLTPIGLAWLWEQRPTAGRWSPLQVLGRSSLFIYFIHLEMVYGGMSNPLHGSFSLPGAWAALAVLSLLMLGVAVLKDRWKGKFLAGNNLGSKLSRQAQPLMF